MAALAQQERHLAAVAPQRVGRPFVREALEVAVDGREANAVELAVQLLRGDGAVGRAEGLEDLPSLLRPSSHAANDNDSHYA